MTEQSFVLKRAERPGPFESRRLFESVAIVIAPAIIGALAVWVFGSGLAAIRVLLLQLLICGLVQHLLRRYPLHLLPFSRFTTIAASSLLAVLLATAAAQTGTGTDVVEPRLVVLAVGSMTAAGAIGVWLLSWYRRRRPIRIAVIGDMQIAVELSEELAESTHGCRMVARQGPIDVEADEAGVLRAKPSQVRAIRRMIVERDIELLAQAPQRMPCNISEEAAVAAALSELCVELGVQLIPLSDLLESELGHVSLSAVGAGWDNQIAHPGNETGMALPRRVLDVLAASILAVLTAPIVLASALALFLVDRGPVLYRQERIGERGRRFEIIKLRTMRPDSEAGGPRWSGAGDARVSPVARAVRHLHIDELPQLWNILRGEMALVGPRPERPEMVAELGDVPLFASRHVTKPGLTGWAQVRCGYAGSPVTNAYKLCHDLFYVKNRTLAFDLLLLPQTAALVARKLFSPDPETQPPPVALPRSLVDL